METTLEHWPVEPTAFDLVASAPALRWPDPSTPFERWLALRGPGGQVLEIDPISPYPRAEIMRNRLAEWKADRFFAPDARICRIESQRERFELLTDPSRLKNTSWIVGGIGLFIFLLGATAMVFGILDGDLAKIGGGLVFLLLGGTMLVLAILPGSPVHILITPQSIEKRIGRKQKARIETFPVAGVRELRLVKETVGTPPHRREQWRSGIVFHDGRVLGLVTGTEQGAREAALNAKVVLDHSFENPLPVTEADHSFETVARARR